MRHHGVRELLVMLAVAGALAAGCGGGGESPSATAGPVSALGWDPPKSYSDNAALDPYKDLDYYEIYVREDGNFVDNDVPMAQIKAVVADPATGATGRLEKEFILENLRPFIGPGKLYYVSLKAVGMDGQRSAFMAPVSWDQRPANPRPVTPI